MELADFDRLATSYDGVRQRRSTGLLRWECRGRLVARQLDDTHVVVLSTSDGTVLRMLVVPPALSVDQGEEALLAASSAAYAHSAASLLDEVDAHPQVDPRDHWTDEGGSWQSDDLIGRPDQ